MEIYNYHPITKEFIGVTEAQKDPLEIDEEGNPKYLIPAYATPEAPIEPGDNQTVVFSDDGWKLAADYRKLKLWDKATLEPYKIEKIDELPDLEKYTEIEPIPGAVWQNGNWVKEKPLAMGTDLINYINQATVKGLADDAAFALVEKLVPFFLYLQQGRCNPASEDTLNTGLTLLDEKLINGNKALLTGLINEWKKDKRFVEPPKGRPKPVKK